MVGASCDSSRQDILFDDRPILINQFTSSVVLSFMSQFSNRDSQGPPSPTSGTARKNTGKDVERQEIYNHGSTAPLASSQQNVAASRDPLHSRHPQRERASSRPVSMIQTYQPPLMEMNQDTLPELQPVFTFFNSHANKLYQEGYFLKLDDQNSRKSDWNTNLLLFSHFVEGKPNADRTWTECFAQLVGTVLSLWDAAELDSAGQDGEVLPKFINITDASIRMASHISPDILSFWFFN